MDSADRNRLSPVCIKFLGYINVPNAEAIVRTIEQKMQEGRTDFYLAMRSPGGSSFTGQWLYEKLRALPISLTTHNRKHVGSAAMEPYLAGERRLVEPDATFLIHRAFFTPEEQARTTSRPDLLPAILRINDAFTARMLSERTQMTREQIEAVMSDEAETSAGDALAMGIAHEVAEIHFPDDAEIIELLFPAQ